MNAEPPRRLPVTITPFTAETIGSFLTRLARENGLRTKTLIQWLGPPLTRRQITPATDTMAHWQSTNLIRLEHLTSRPLNRLALALPALTDTLAGRESDSTSTVIRACRSCTAAKGIASPVYRRARPHEHLCQRHRRWLRAATDTDLTRTPEVLTAQNQLNALARRHDDTVIFDALREAHKVISAWHIRIWHPALSQRWDSRLNSLLTQDAARPGAPAATVPVVIHPEVVTIASALASYLAGADPDRELSGLTTALGLPDGRLPGDRDPLRLCLRQSADRAARPSTESAIFTVTN